MADRQHRILILTDSEKHNGKESLFPIAGHLCENPSVASVHIADRADTENAGFFSDLDPGFDAFYAHKIDNAYGYEPEHDTASYPAEILPAKKFDTVWVRIDHPVSNEFLGYLRRLLPNHFIVNNPDGLVKTMSKEFMSELTDVLGEFMPAQKLCHTADEVEAFKALCPDGVVLKQVLSYGGKGVVRYRDHHEAELHSKDEVAAYLAENGLCLAMEYLNPAEGQSDNRVLIMNGEVLFVVQRIAKEGGWLCNLTSGALAVDAPVTEREIEIAKRLDPIMRGQGIFLYGADMLLNSRGERVLSEVNTLNVGTIAVSEKLTGRPLTKFIADNLVACIVAGKLDIPVIGLEKLAA